MEPVTGVHTVLAPDSPIFMVAGNGNGPAIAFLAQKDDLGNP